MRPSPVLQWPRERTFILFKLGEERYSWKGLVWLLGLYTFGLLFAAIVSPLVYILIQDIASHHPNGIAAYVEEKGLSQTFDRMRWFWYLLAVPFLLCKCGFFSHQGLGVSLNGINRSNCYYAFTIGCLSIITIAFVQNLSLGNQARLLVSDGSLLSLVVTTLIFALFSGLILSIVEEVLLRGVLFRLFYTALTPFAAAVISALLFAALHFKDIPSFVWDDDMTVSLSSSFTIAGGTIVSIFYTWEPTTFFNLFLVGLILNLLFLRTKSLWPCIALHASWVTTLRLYKEFFNVRETWMGSEAIIDGWLTTLVLSFLALFLIAALSRYYYAKASIEVQNPVSSRY